MSPGTKVRKGIKIAPAEAESLDPQQIVMLHPNASHPVEVEGQTPCTSIQCLYCGKSGRLTRFWFQVNISGVSSVALWPEADFSARGLRFLNP